MECLQTFDVEGIVLSQHLLKVFAICIPRQMACSLMIDDMSGCTGESFIPVHVTGMLVEC